MYNILEGCAPGPWLDIRSVSRCGSNFDVGITYYRKASADSSLRSIRLSLHQSFYHHMMATLRPYRHRSPWLYLLSSQLQSTFSSTGLTNRRIQTCCSTHLVDMQKHSTIECPNLGHIRSCSHNWMCSLFRRNRVRVHTRRFLGHFCRAVSDP